jgi:cytochrome c5
MNQNIPVCAAALLFVSFAFAQPLDAEPTRRAPPTIDANRQHLPEGRGKALIQTACTQCHSIDVAISQPRSRDEWTDVVSRMIGNGAHLSDDDYSLVIDYLSKHHGP